MANNKMTHVSVCIRRWSRSKDKVMEKLITDAIPYEYEAAQKAYHYAQRILKKRWKEGEKTILRNAKFAYLYAKNIIKGRWIEAEPVIAECEYSSYYYSKFVLKKRFPMFELRLQDKKGSVRYGNESYIHMYARDIQKERLPKKIERRLAKCGRVSAEYAVDVMKKRWKSVEKTIAKSDERSIDKYIRSLSIKDRRSFRTLLLAEAMAHGDHKYYWCPAKNWLERNEKSDKPVEFN